MDPGNAGTLIYVEDKQQLFDLLVPDNVDFAPFAILMEVGLLTDENTEYLLDASIRHGSCLPNLKLIVRSASLFSYNNIRTTKD